MEYTIRYPRRVFVRSLLKMLGRGAFALLTRTRVTGREHLPKRGPLIVVGNHIATIETALMVLHVPWLIEMVGAGDIPLDPRFSPIMNGWGYIPIRRGSVDRDGTTMMLDVLKQNGVVGMFPEGGIWETSNKGARTGVAWLSYKARAPILPMGFGGLQGAIVGMFKLRRPRLTVNIGELIPPITLNPRGRKDALEDAANMVMDRIEALVPTEDRKTNNRIQDERFDFEVTVRAADGNIIETPLTVVHTEALSKFFHRPLMLDVMARNLKRPVQPLQRLDTDPSLIASATQEIIAYLENENPQFLNYRFGYEMGGAMLAGLIELRDLARWAAQHQYTLTLKPIRRFHLIDSADEHLEERPGALHEH